MTGQACLLNSMGNQTSSQLPPHSPQAVNLAIVTSYQFHCCGNITNWQAYVILGRRLRSYNVRFSVWRPTTLTEEACYNLVGEDNLTRNTWLSGDDVYNVTTLSRGITVQPGDVVGFIVNSNRSSDGVLLDRRSSSESVWYHPGRVPAWPLQGRPASCQVSVEAGGILRSFTAAAPVLSIALGNSQG